MARKARLWVRLFFRIRGLADRCVDSWLVPAVVRGLGVEVGRGVTFNGFPLVRLRPGARISLGEGTSLVSRCTNNLAGINHPVILATAGGAEIAIGRQCGLSGATINATRSISLGDHVLLGVNAAIYDTDFHPVDWHDRRENRREAIRSAPVVIEDDVFIGANALVLKGVRIGARSIVAAGAVVVRDVPADCVVAGNPARVVKRLTGEMPAGDAATQESHPSR